MISKERLLDELKKLTKLETMEKIAKNKVSLELLQTIFPELKNIVFFSKLNPEKRDIISEVDFILLLSLMIIDGTDNADYFLYKFKPIGKSLYIPLITIGIILGTISLLPNSWTVSVISFWLSE